MKKNVQEIFQHILENIKSSKTIFFNDSWCYQLQQLEPTDYQDLCKMCASMNYRLNRKIIGWRDNKLSNSIFLLKEKQKEKRQIRKLSCLLRRKLKPSYTSYDIRKIKTLSPWWYQQTPASAYGVAQDGSLEWIPKEFKPLWQVNDIKNYRFIVLIFDGHITKPEVQSKECGINIFCVPNLDGFNKNNAEKLKQFN